MATSSTTGQQTLDSGQIDALRSTIRGEIILPDDAAYDEARHVFNAMIDRHPAVIVRCTDVADVISAVNFGRQAQLNVSVRGGRRCPSPTIKHPRGGHFKPKSTRPKKTGMTI